MHDSNAPRFGARTIDEFADALAGNTPVPGGGALAPVVAMLSASLAQMVVAFSQGKPALAQHASEHGTAMRILPIARRNFERLAHEDAEAYAGLNAVLTEAKDAPGRRERLEAAAMRAASVPFRAMEACVELLKFSEYLLGKTNRYLESDLVISAILSEACARACMPTLRVNADLLTEVDRDGLLRVSEQMLGEARALLGRFDRGVAQG
ncbi:MAG: cyclodeaminase/cyclohydrolase family protein [Planctomycetota bacterium]